jgi:hypothetical protein
MLYPGVSLMQGVIGSYELACTGVAMAAIVDVTLITRTHRTKAIDRA